MSEGDQTSQCVLGFLSVLAHEHLGLVGGYLILNAAARPLEFHCTAPVKANRSQQILFGPTLDAFLYGEQIGQTLITASALTTWAVFTDVEPALVLRDFVSQPAALVLANESEMAPRPGEHSPWRAAAISASGSLRKFNLGHNALAVATSRAADEQQIRDRLAALQEFDLSEPFRRIREAIEETHRNTRAA